MKLESNYAAVIDNPSDGAIATTLAEITNSHENRYAILGPADLDSYMQALYNGSLHLEYQAGSLDRHYRAQSATLTLARITKAFQHYARGDERWEQAFVWEKMDLSPS